MKTYFSLLGFLALLAPASCFRVQLLVREAGAKGKFGPELKSGTTFCPKFFSERGFSVECTAPPSARSASFRVNGRFQRREMATPFMIAGDHAGIIFPWSTFKSGKNVISCAINTGESVTAEVVLDCGEEMPGKKKKAADKRSKSTPKPRPVEVPRLGPVSTKSCTTISATDYVGSLSKGWEIVADGIFYKKDDPFAGVVPPSTARVTYKFTPPVTSKYAFVLDMTTSHPTEHNGMLLRCISPSRPFFVLDVTDRPTFSFRRLLCVHPRGVDPPPLWKDYQGHWSYQGLP